MLGSPKIALLTNDEMKKIHAAALDVLANVGMIFPAKEALDVFKKAGAEVDYTKSLVNPSPDLINECIKKAPRTVELWARDKKYNETLGDGNAHFGAFGGATYIKDIDSGLRRRATNKDLADAIRIVDASENVSFTEQVVNPQDVPQKVLDTYAWATMLKNTVKHVHGCATTAACARNAIKMGSAITGDKETLRKKPILNVFILTVPPLSNDGPSLEGIMEAAENGIPITISSGNMAGATAPVTLAGGLTLGAAEVLCTAALVQLINPGNPVIYAVGARILDMKTTNVSLGCPEWALSRICNAEMAHYFGLPSWGMCLMTESKIFDAQAGYEKMASLLMAMLSGNDQVWGGLMDSNNVASLEGLVIENEMVGMVRRIIRGIDINEETLAVNVIREIGPEQTFLKSKHTLRHYRNELWMPAIAERRFWDDWMRDGGKDIQIRAKAKAREILRSHVVEPLPGDVVKEIDRIVSEAEKAQ